MKRQGRFLTAEWINIVMLNYAVDVALLQRLVPAGTELDTFDGKTYVSLIGFEFNRTRVLGVPIPFHQAFEEVNLRFYVRRAAKRGVVFIRELVPKYAVAAIARFAFNENYSRVPMSHWIEARANEGIVEAEYSWGWKTNRCRIWIEAEGPGYLPPEGSGSQWITEHYWGYAAKPNGGCLEYEVQHPQWRIRGAKKAGYAGDLAGYYGAEMTKALAGEPDSAFLAEGSPVTVFKGTRIGGSV